MFDVSYPTPIPDEDQNKQMLSSINVTQLIDVSSPSTYKSRHKMDILDKMEIKTKIKTQHYSIKKKIRDSKNSNS